MKPNLKTFAVGLTMLVLASLGSKRNTSFMFTSNLPTGMQEIKTTQNSSHLTFKDQHTFIKVRNNSKANTAKAYLVSSSFSKDFRNLSDPQSRGIR